MGKKRKPIPEYLADLKKIRNAVYEIENARNPITRSRLLSEASSIAHDTVEKWKRKDLS